MKRHIPGLHSRQPNGELPWRACSWFASNGPPTAGIRKRPSCRSDSSCSNPKSFGRRSFSGRLYSTERALWKLNWFLRDFGYDMELLTQDQMDEKALINLRGVVRTTYKTLNGHTFQNLEAFAPESDWAELSLAEASVSSTYRNSDDLQLHPDQPVPALPAQLSLPLSRWLAREGHPGRHGLWPLL
jgi:hypothetical protein